MPENHRGILVEQLNDILRQLQADPTKIPLVRFTPEEVMSPTRETRERNQSEEARVRMTHHFLTTNANLFMKLFPFP